LRLSKGSTEWVRSGDLNSARSAPAGSVLNDGRLLIAGGYYSDLPDDPPVRMVSSAEIFDPATEHWSRTGSLGQARFGASAVTLTDGRVLIAGGGHGIPEDSEGWFGPDGPLASAELFDAATGSFSATGALPWAVVEAPLVALPDGDALVVDGGRAARFDATAESWTETPPMHLRVDLRTVVALGDGSVLVAGGMPDWEHTTPDPMDPYSTRAERYDPATDRWTEIAPMPSGRALGAGVLLADGSVLIAGGKGGPGEPGDPSCPDPALDAVRFIPT
jgi:N-acetylneuraminic acid mutarotase